jgi:hypothetical protein
VGYITYNIWRIWIPVKHKVICTRDCIFNKTKLYKQKIKHELINNQNNQSLEALSREEFDQLIEQTAVQTIKQNTNQSNQYYQDNQITQIEPQSNDEIMEA